MALVAKIHLEHGGIEPTSAPTRKSPPSSALYLATLNGLVGTVKHLRSSNLDKVCGNYRRALQAASAMGQLASVVELAQLGACVNVQAGQCGSTLDATASNGHTAIVRFLLDQRPSPSIVDPYRRSALYLAC